MTPDQVTATPVGYVHEVLKCRPYDWQAEVLTWFEETRGRLKVSVAAPNGAGKDDGLIAWLALWWVGVHPRGRVVITSRDSRQIDEQTQPALRKHAAKLPGWRFLDRIIHTPTGGKVILFTTDEAGRAEGWHKEDDVNGPLLIIVNEAKSVPDPIFTAFDRCTFNAILYVSSTGLKRGRFYESHTKLAGSFKRKVVRLEDCPHIPREKIDDLLLRYGADHPFIRSTLYSEFMSEDDAARFLFPVERLEAVIRHPPPFARTGDRTAFCDFAAGGDENVLMIREGNKFDLVAAWRERDTMSAVGRFLALFQEHRLRAEEIFADEGGLGKSMCDRLREMGWDVNRVNNGGKPFDPRYENRGAEMWHETSLALDRLIIPDDGDLIAQLTTRQVKWRSDGKLGIMSKEDMRKMGLPSPDRADSFVGAQACRPYQWQQKGDLQTVWEEFAQETGEETYWPAGANPGM